MADKTGIEWTDATVNFWWGCTKVGPGCDHCYAETWSRRTGGQHWGIGAPRRKIGSAPNLLRRLNDGAVKWAKEHDGRARRVFVQSMSDLFDLEVELPWFAEAWDHIQLCDCLDIQIVTKRISVVEKRLDAIGSIWPRHAGLIITVCNQAEADRDIPRLLALKAELGIPWVGLSIEPMLGPIDLECVPRPSKWPAPIDDHSDGIDPLRYHGPEGPLHIDWVIIGGESGGKARPCWTPDVRRVVKQCKRAGVAVLVKQLGSNVQDRNDAGFEGCGPTEWPDIDPGLIEHDVNGYCEEYQGAPCRIRLRDRKGGDPSEWPEDLRVREFPKVRT